jgi:hypothetical protein
MIVSKKLNSNLLERPCTTSLSLVARSAVPDTNCLSLESIFTAEVAEMFGLLCDFVFLGTFSQVSTVSGSVLSDNACFLSSFGLNNGKSSEQ